MKFMSRSTYGIIVGGIHVIGFISTTIFIITVLCKVSDVSSQDAEFRNDKYVDSSLTVLYVLLVLCLISVLTSILLIIGIIKRRSSLMRPWIWSAICGIGIQIFCIIVQFFTAMVNDVGSVFSSLCVGLLILGIQFVFFHPVYTLYKQIRDPNKETEECAFSNQQNPPSYSEIERGGDTFNSKM